jgi:HK97 family phage major capsid protein
MTLHELKNKRNKLMADAQAISLKPILTAEDRSAFDAMIADADVVETDITRLERVAGFEQEQRALPTPPRPQPGAGSDNPEERSKRVKTALVNFVTRGMIGGDLRLDVKTGLEMETRDLTTAGAAGAYIPQAFYPVLFDALKDYGQIINIVRNIESDNGAPTKYATDNDTANLFYEIAEDTDAATDGSNGTDPVIAGSMLTCSLLTRQPILVSIPELQDSAFDIDAFVRNIIGRSYYRGLSALIVNGSTSGNIASILNINAGAITTSLTAGGLVITYPDLTALYGSLDPAYEGNSTWTLNSKVRAYLMGVTDTLGRPLYIPAPNAGAFDTLLGRPIKLVQQLPSLAPAAMPIQFGDFNQGYLLKTVRPGLGIMRLNERYADKLAVGFVPYARVGGALIDAGTHPIVGLKMHA